MAADEEYTKSTVREYYEALLIAVIFVTFARIFVFQAFKIPSPSMEDNLKVGDHIIVNKFIFGSGTSLGELTWASGTPGYRMAANRSDGSGALLMKLSIPNSAI